MSLYGSPKTREERLKTKIASIQSRLNRGGLDPQEAERAQARLAKTRKALAGLRSGDYLLQDA
jgi:hypothetical protein